jgi:hypothetical protein
MGASEQQNSCNQKPDAVQHPFTERGKRRNKRHEGRETLSREETDRIGVIRKTPITELPQRRPLIGAFGNERRFSAL